MRHPSSSRDRTLSEGSDAAAGSDAPGVHADADAGGSRIKVGVSELAVAADGETLTTSGLGSCVAVALVDEADGVRGLLHAMLPTGTGTDTGIERPGKYVDTGIETLIAELEAAGASPGRLEARVAGGAEMLDLTDAVGPRNVARAEQYLDAVEIPVVERAVGDGVGRTVRFRPDGRLVVRAADGFQRTL
ncbi:chemotaxis protein CheD [Halorubrum amylolyticum]|uniref:chemotaxis protein CheD n=1 Tax=Halorubrum amylolyticum TaxID=2508724 RepID=UPI00100929C9|nr:chemotaxis protein CheD [Halorubrum amylolyticum]